MAVFMAALLYTAVLVLVVGLLIRIRRYSAIPAPLKIPTMPAPTSTIGVAGRLFRETVFFESLFKASRWTWIFGWTFHAGLFFVLLCHLRFFTSPVWWWVALIAPYSKYFGLMMVTGLAGLLVRRICVDRVRYISAPSDFLMLLLLLCLAGSGLLMSTVFFIDLFSVNKFALGLKTLSVDYLPASPVLIIHLTLVACLLLIFPFSKLLHAPGLFFSPSRNQVDNSRERRHTGDKPS